MNSGEAFPDQKHAKEQRNQEIHSPKCPNFSEACSKVLEKNLDETSVQQIKDIFAKTEAMKEVAKVKNEQLEQQFVDLKQRLSTSSQYLLKIKKNIENLKFSYQKNVLEMNQSLDTGECLSNTHIQTADDMAKHMEDIRKKIENLQLRTKAQTQKHQSVTENYQNAFQNVVKALQDIEQGSYSSQQYNCAQT